MSRRRSSGRWQPGRPRRADSLRGGDLSGRRAVVEGGVRVLEVILVLADLRRGVQDLGLGASDPRRDEPLAEGG
jgi:hypothetical protein